MTGSSLPERARSVRSIEYFSSADSPPSDSAEVTRLPPRDASKAACSASAGRAVADRLGLGRDAGQAVGEGLTDRRRDGVRGQQRQPRLRPMAGGTVDAARRPPGIAPGCWLAHHVGQRLRPPGPPCSRARDSGRGGQHLGPQLRRGRDRALRTRRHPRHPGPGHPRHRHPEQPHGRARGRPDPDVRSRGRHDTRQPGQPDRAADAVAVLPPRPWMSTGPGTSSPSTCSTRPRRTWTSSTTPSRGPPRRPWPT